MQNQHNEPLLQGSIQGGNSYAQQPQQPIAPQEHSRENANLRLQRWILIGGMVVLLVVIGILGWGMYRNSTHHAQPIYIMYNATIYASSYHSAPHSSNEDDNNNHNRDYGSDYDLNFHTNTAMVIGSDGRFYDLGFDEAILTNQKYTDLPRVNMNRAVISPGFADAHGHFMSYGLGFLEPDTHSTKSPTEFVQQLLSFCKEHHIDPQGESESWLIGGRWDESQWQTDPNYDYYVDPETGAHPFPHRKMLDRAFPKMGVALKRIDGHACLVNQVVLDIVQLPDENPPGGQIIRDADGKPTGVLIDYACDIIWKYKQSQPSALHYRTALTKSMQQLSALGLTSIHDASMLNAPLFASHLALPRKLIASNKDDDDDHHLLLDDDEEALHAPSAKSLYDPFPMRVHAMVDAEAICAVYNYTCPDPFPFQPIDQSNHIVLKNGTRWVQPDRFDIDPGMNVPDFNILPQILNAKNGRYDVSATKMMADGALGSWGAFLSQPYTDKPTTQGIQMYTQPQLNNAVLNLVNQGFQVCTHAIGDGAVQQVLDSYVYAAENYNTTAASPEIRRAQFIQQRHRVEHFQIIPEHNNWAPVMEKYGILASMQSIHAVQDRSFAESRLGTKRLHDQGYLWREIETANDIIALGTDFPVSAPSVIENVYAAVTMMEIGHDDLPPFLPDNTLHVTAALAGVTADPAYAQHREHEYGRIAKGYIADFVILSEDWLGFNPGRDIGKIIASTKVLATFVDGNAVFEHQDANVIKAVEGTTVLKHQYEFTTSAKHGEKKAWHAIRQPSKPPMSKTLHDPHFFSVANALKMETLDYITTGNTDQLVNGLGLEELQQHSLFTPFAIESIQTTQQPPTQQQQQQPDPQLEFWHQMRFLAPANRLQAIQDYIAMDKNGVAQNFKDTFDHKFITMSETPVKVIEREYGHHHHARDSSKYRAATIYKTKDENGKDILVQPRVPPCIEHMGGREAAERRHFSHPDLETITKSEQIQLGLGIVN